MLKPIYLLNVSNSFIVTVPNPKNAQNPVNSLIHHWVLKRGPPRYHSTGTGTKYFNTEMANCCTQFAIRPSPRTSYGPWTN